MNKDGTETYETRLGNEVYYSRATFDTKKQMIKLEDVDETGKPIGTIYNSEFDKQGNETKSETIYKTGKPSVTINEYDYDTKGNWIIKREKPDYGKKIIEREIVYW